MAGIGVNVGETVPLPVPEVVRVNEGVRVLDGVSDHVRSGVPVTVGVCVTVPEKEAVPVRVFDVVDPIDDVLVKDPVLDDVLVRLAILGVDDEDAVGV